MSAAAEKERTGRGTATAYADDFALTAPNPEEIRLQIAARVAAEEEPGQAEYRIPELDAQASTIVQKLVAFDPADADAATQRIAAVEKLGEDVQRKATIASTMLKTPIKELAARGEDGGIVAQSLVDLRMQVEELDPYKFDFNPGWVTRLLGLANGKLKRYFIRYESADTVITAILDSMRKGGEQLKRDNIALTEDQKRLRQNEAMLKRAIYLAQQIDRQLTQQVEEVIPEADPRNRFIKEELIFPLCQRIQDLQQHMLVCQQGFMAMEVIIRTNKELIRGVKRAENVTIEALKVAVVLALALANQKIVLTKLEAINKTTENMLARNAEALATQAVQTYERAASAQMNIDVLAEALRKTIGALNAISDFRVSALPKMQAQISEMDGLIQEAEERILQLDQGNRVREEFIITVDGDVVPATKPPVRQ